MKQTYSEGKMVYEALSKEIDYFQKGIHKSACS